MHTRCPKCHTLFQVEGAQLAQANGHAKCCQCSAVFNALDHEVNASEAIADNGDTSSLNTDIDSSEFDWLNTEIVDNKLIKPNSLPDPTADSGFTELLNDSTQLSPTDITGYSELLEDLDDIAPTHDANTLDINDVLESRRPRFLPVLFGGILICILGLALIVQVLWNNKTQAIQYDETRWVLEKVCSIANCKVPLRSDPSKIVVVGSEVVLGNDAFLSIQLMIDNQALFNQPYPSLQVTLLDTEEHIVAQRTFMPNQYVNQYQPDMLIPSEQLQRIQLDLVDPGENATGYRFKFL